MADLDSLIGCKISLISHQDVRYDGNLFSINQAESSIVLKDVQVYGTEDRLTDPAKVVAASVAIIPFVTFPGTEIKDLYVHESSTAAEPAALPTPPAAAPASKPSADNKPARNQNNRPKNETVHPPKPPAHHEEPSKGKTSGEQQTSSSFQQNNNNNSSNNNNNQQQHQRTAAGTGSHLLRMREKKGHGKDDAISSADATNTEFNFEENLQNFKKEEVLKTVATSVDGNNTVPNVKKYAKDDFFDNISNDASGTQTKARFSAADERQLNQDTFGAIALQSNYRRGGRGRGGRGRGSSYNNNNNGGGYSGGRGGGNGRGGNSYGNGGGGRGGGGGSGGRGGGYRNYNNNRPNNNTAQTESK